MNSTSPTTQRESLEGTHTPFNLQEAIGPAGKQVHPKTSCPAASPTPDGPLAPENREIFEKLTKGLATACIGSVTDSHTSLKIKNGDKTVADLGIDALDRAFNKTFGEMI